MGNMFVEFTNRVHQFYSEQPQGAAEVDALLAYIYGQNQQGRPVRVTDLVRIGHYGTLPTVHRRLKALAEDAMVTLTVGTDKRTRHVAVAPRGVALLESRSSLLLVPVTPR